MEWLYIVITIVLSGFFSGSELAFVSANKLKLEIASRRPGFLAKCVQFFLQKPDRFLVTTLVGNNIVNVAYATVMAIFVAEPISQTYTSLFGQEPGTITLLLIQTVIASVIIMLMGEIIPKAIFRIHASSLAVAMSIPLRMIYFVLYPIIVISQWVSTWLLKLIGAGTESTEQLFRRQDVEMIFKELRDSGGSEDLDEDDSTILHNVLELSNKRVKESMIPRTEIEAIDKDSSIEDARNLFISTGHSKLPVYEKNIDNVIGVIFAHDLFNQPDGIMDIIRPVKLVPVSKKSKDLLTEFRQDNMSIAIVLDEYGGTAGMMTIEDVLEEVVGDIQDEYDVDEHFIKQLSENVFVLSAGLEIEELQEKYPQILEGMEPNEFETVAGLIIHELGRIPKVNEEVLVGRLKFIISKATQSRLEIVKLTLLEED